MMTKQISIYSNAACEIVNVMSKDFIRKLYIMIKKAITRCLKICKLMMIYYNVIHFNIWDKTLLKQRGCCDMHYIVVNESYF